MDLGTRGECLPVEDGVMEKEGMVARLGDRVAPGEEGEDCWLRFDFEPDFFKEDEDLLDLLSLGRIQTDSRVLML